MILPFHISVELEAGIGGGANEGSGPFAPEDGGPLNQPGVPHRSVSLWSW